MSRQSLLNELSSLRQTTIKEWFKQAYFRKEKQLEYSLISEELQTIHSLLQVQLSSQEEFIISNLSSSDPKGFTPRFLTLHQSLQSDQSSFANALKSLASIKALFHQLIENQKIIFLKLPSGRETNLSVELSEKLQKEKEKLQREKEKVQKITKKYNDLNLHFIAVSENLEEIRNQSAQECEECVGLRERIEELERDSLNAEMERVKQMYEELKQAHDQIVEELNGRIGDEELELERENLLRQVAYLEGVQKKMSLNNSELMKRLESETGQINKLHEFIEDYEEEVTKKNLALEKAQGIIKKLNMECEKLAKDLEKAENENDSLKKENRALCKTKNAVDKKINEIETMKKTEERLRDEVSALKNKLSSAIDQYEVQINHLNGLLTQQSQEKNNLELTLEELEQKLIEIESINARRIEEFTQSVQKITDLEELIRKKDENLQKVKEDIERIVANKDQEFQHMKKQSENLLRQLNSSLSAKPKRVEKKINEFAQINLAEQLQDALARESKLKSSITDLINQEGKALNDLLSTFNKNISVHRAETEKWIMRNEELEQRLIDSVNKNLKFINTIKDLQKILIFKNQQFEEYSKNSEILSRELLNKNEFLQLELKNNYKLINKELLPNSQKVMNQNLSFAHEKLHSLREHLAQLEQKIMSDEEKLSIQQRNVQGLEEEILSQQQNIEGLEDEVLSQQRTIQGLEEEKEGVLRLLDKANDSIEFIRKKLDDVQIFSVSQHSPTVSQMESLPEMTEKVKSIVAKVEILKENEREYREKINLDQLEVLHLQKKIKEHTEGHELLQQSYERSQDEIRYLTEIVYKDKEEIIKLKTVLNEALKDKEKINELVGYLSQIKNEKDLIEEKYFVVRSELEKTQMLIEEKGRKVENMEENCFLLRSELEKTQAILGAKFKKYEENEENYEILREELEKTQSLLEAKTKKFDELRESDLKEISCLKTKLESVGGNNKTVRDESIEKLKKKNESDKRNFQKRVKEFELVLKYIGDRINVLINKSCEPGAEKMNVFIEELKKKNPNLTLWLRGLVTNLEKLSQI